ncbi:MAG TPA: transporter substrate-binding domain-containing protein [Burkholderiales bacterium]|jgi:polar amino acid transport system substrate-binding protein|nr:transporter substrate-binding domain-containing protein [Burkholderiales bacterium]
MKKIAVIGAFALAAGCAQTPPAPSPEAKSQLAPSGTLRVAVLTSNPIIGVKDASSGEVKGTTVDLGRALAAGAGVPARIIDYPAIPQLMADAATNTWDVAVVAIDPARRSLVDFAPAHLAADGFLTILVPPGSSARTMADFDKPGMRVAAVKNAAPLMILERTLKNAKVVASDNENDAFGLMREGKAEGYAQNRFILRARAQTLPGSRLLDDAFSGLQLAFALPKNRPAAAQYVATFVEDAKKSGEIQRAIDKAGLAGEVKVAPPAQK